MTVDVKKRSSSRQSKGREARRFGIVAGSRPGAVATSVDYNLQMARNFMEDGQLDKAKQYFGRARRLNNRELDKTQREIDVEVNSKGWIHSANPWVRAVEKDRSGYYNHEDKVKSEQAYFNKVSEVGEKIDNDLRRLEKLRKGQWKGLGNKPEDRKIEPVGWFGRVKKQLSRRVAALRDSGSVPAGDYETTISAAGNDLKRFENELNARGSDGYRHSTRYTSAIVKDIQNSRRLRNGAMVEKAIALQNAAKNLLKEGKVKSARNAYQSANGVLSELANMTERDSKTEGQVYDQEVKEYEAQKRWSSAPLDPAYSEHREDMVYSQGLNKWAKKEQERSERNMLRLEKLRHGKWHGLEGKAQTAAAAVAIVGFLGALFLIYPAGTTANVIGVNQVAANWIGAGLFVLGLMGAWFYTRKK